MTDIGLSLAQEVTDSRTPLVIAYHDEADNIEPLLSSIREKLGKYVRVIVMDVASSGDSKLPDGIASDGEIEIFRHDTNEKLGALQAVYKHLGDAALKPVLHLDADVTVPNPTVWYQSMMKPLDDITDRPVVVTGKVIHTHEQTCKTARKKQLAHLIGKMINALTKGELPAEGCSQGFRMHDQSTLDAFFGLPSNIWPNEDLVIADTVANSNTGGVRAYVTKHGSEVRNPDRHGIILWSRDESEEKYRIEGQETIHGMDYHADNLGKPPLYNPYKSRSKLPRSLSMS